MCHNDLNNENIMLIDREVYFIDFEYSRNNYVAYDIANFLNEAAVDYSVKEYPNFKIREDCLPTMNDIREVCKAYIGKGGATEYEFNVLCDETYRCLALCNFYWAVWSLIMDNSHTPFGYVEHAGKKLELFERIYKDIRGVQL